MEGRSPGEALVSDYEAGVAVEPVEPLRDVAEAGPPWLAATLPALDLAAGSVRALRRAAVRAGARGPLAEAPLDLSRVAAAFSSDRLLRLDGRVVARFAPLSGFYRTADGWVRTHANYPHHEHRLLAALHLHGVGGGPGSLTPALHGVGPADIAQALRALTAQQVEDAATAARAVAARVRTEEEWRSSPQGVAAAEGPLVRLTPRDDGAEVRAAGASPHGTPRLPLAGVRVLDLTRVIAGPVGTRTLALLGADVLRIDPPVPAEVRWQHLDTGQGKRTALLDLHDAGDHAQAQALLDEADVLVTGYRPGAIEAFGLRPPPGLVHARVSAWGETGPWSARRGFDSIVQAATGIALIEAQHDADGHAGWPSTLPAQALDHASGYLLAAGVLDALTARRADGRGRDVVASLARTATWLLDAPGRDPGHPPAAPVTAVETVTHGRGPEVTTARPALPGFDDYPAPAHPWGTDHARW
ncbi:hypothetical protein ET495_12315 [Xylanimonas allomyrinae]|uniref:CoA transferase n=1 Tax=Xylanimonas allomyrinae TaxID=2509459 RepID=A0A4P6ETZ9_9MICO|nr:CoA transferase [Xylanimonas allomyrinae]QAY63887.1 hypothetical protein ET495_12315 [Xylanimonas allomyrinae]